MKRTQNYVCTSNYKMAFPFTVTVAMTVITFSILLHFAFVSDVDLSISFFAFDIPKKNRKKNNEYIEMVFESFIKVSHEFSILLCQSIAPNVTIAILSIFLTVVRRLEKVFVRPCELNTQKKVLDK